MDMFFFFWFYYNDGFSFQLKDTGERILAVDRAAAMVEEMLKQGPSLQAVGSTLQPLSNGTKVWLH